MQVPTHPADTFLADTTAGEGDQSTYTNADESGPSFDAVQSGGDDAEEGGDSGDLTKPTVGSDEWTRLRKDNHKEGGSYPTS